MMRHSPTNIIPFPGRLTNETTDYTDFTDENINFATDSIRYTQMKKLLDLSAFICLFISLRRAQSSRGKMNFLSVLIPVISVVMTVSSSRNFASSLLRVNLHHLPSKPAQVAFAVGPFGCGYAALGNPWSDRLSLATHNSQLSWGTNNYYNLQASVH
jgi:hypothetical protein